jgi:hypothetical protein
MDSGCTKLRPPNTCSTQKEADADPMKPGSRDLKVKILIAGEELSELQRHTWQMAEAFGLRSRIERYQGKRAISLWRWDMDCLLDVVPMALDDPREYPSKECSGWMALRRLQERLQAAYRSTYD